MRIYTHTHTHTHTHAHTHTHTHTQTSHTHTHNNNTHTHAQTSHTHTHTHTSHTHTRTRTHRHYSHTHAHTHTATATASNTCTSVCVCVCPPTPPFPLSTTHRITGDIVQALLQNSVPFNRSLLQKRPMILWILGPYSVDATCTGWRRLIGSPKLQILFHKTATKYRSLLQKMTYKDKGSYESSPPCTLQNTLDPHLILRREKYSRDTPWIDSIHLETLHARSTSHFETRDTLDTHILAHPSVCANPLHI